MDCVALTVSGNPVNRENQEIATPVNRQRLAGTQSVSASSSGTAIAGANISTGLVGYLARIKVAGTGACLWTVMAGSTVLGYVITNADASDEYEPPHRFFDQCPAGQAFSVTPTNLTGGTITVYCTLWWDQF